MNDLEKKVFNFIKSEADKLVREEGIPFVVEGQKVTMLFARVDPYELDKFIASLVRHTDGYVSFNLDKVNDVTRLRVSSFDW